MNGSKIKFIIVALTVMCLSVSAQADQKAVDEAKCEAKCQHDATVAATACKEVAECIDYVGFEFRSCMKACDAE